MSNGKWFAITTGVIWVSTAAFQMYRAKVMAPVFEKAVEKMGDVKLNVDMGAPVAATCIAALFFAFT